MRSFFLLSSDPNAVNFKFMDRKSRLLEIILTTARMARKNLNSRNLIFTERYIDLLLVRDSGHHIVRLHTIIDDLIITHFHQEYNIILLQEFSEPFQWLPTYRRTV